MIASRRNVIVIAFGTTQTWAWASSYDLPAVLAGPISADLGLDHNTFFAIFSIALLISAVLGPSVGRAIDLRGGRGVLMLSNLVFAAGLVLLATAQGIVSLSFAWLVLGIGMGMGLYDSAFAALACIYGRAARGPITGITLIAGFASTVGWPVTAALADGFGWREACLFWATANLCLGLPLNWLIGPAQVHLPAASSEPLQEVAGVPRYATALLAFVFATTWFVTSAMAAHLPRLLESAGATPAAAIAAAALVGPAQVAARLFEFGLLRQLHPLVCARLAVLLHPAGALVLGLFGGPLVAGFTLLHGAGNGMITIAKGTLPLAIFGPVGYGRRNGLIGAPARASQAAAPLVFGLLLDRYGIGVLAVSAGLNLVALAALFLLRQPAAAERPA